MLPLLVVVTAVGLNVVSTQAAPVPSKIKTRDYSKLFPRGISDGDPSEQPQSSVPQAIDGSVPAQAVHRSPHGSTDSPLNPLVGSKDLAVAKPSETSRKLPRTLNERLQVLRGERMTRLDFSMNSSVRSKDPAADLLSQVQPTTIWPDNTKMPINQRLSYLTGNHPGRLLPSNTPIPFRIGPPGGPEGYFTTPSEPPKISRKKRGQGGASSHSKEKRKKAS